MTLTVERWWGFICLFFSANLYRAWARRTAAFNLYSERILRQIPGPEEVEGDGRAHHFACEWGPRRGRSLGPRVSACVRARLPHSAHRAEAPVRTFDCGVRQQQSFPQSLSPDKGPASFQPRVARRPEVLMPRLRGALGVGGAATGRSSAPSFPARSPGRAGAVRLRRSCGRGVGPGAGPWRWRRRGWLGGLPVERRWAYLEGDGSRNAVTFGKRSYVCLNVAGWVSWWQVLGDPGPVGGACRERGPGLPGERSAGSWRGQRATGAGLGGAEVSGQFETVEGRKAGGRREGRPWRSVWGQRWASCLAYTWQDWGVL